MKNCTKIPFVTYQTGKNSAMSTQLCREAVKNRCPTTLQGSVKWCLPIWKVTCQIYKILCVLYPGAPSLRTDPKAIPVHVGNDHT